MKLLYPLFLVLAFTSCTEKKGTPVKIDPNETHSELLNKPKLVYLIQAKKDIETHMPHIDMTEYSFDHISVHYWSPDTSTQTKNISVIFNKKGSTRRIKRSEKSTLIEHDSIRLWYDSGPEYRRAIIYQINNNKTKTIEIYYDE